MTVRVQSSLQISQGNLQYQSQPTAFQPTMLGANGPTPGAVTISTTGTDISLAQLDSPGGLCRFLNIDSTNLVRIGPRDANTGVFYPFLDVGPGESFVVRLSGYLGKEEVGTGTFNGVNVHLHAVAVNAPVILVTDAFDA